MGSSDSTISGMDPPVCRYRLLLDSLNSLTAGTIISWQLLPLPSAGGQMAFLGGQSNKAIACFAYRIAEKVAALIRYQ